MCMLEVNEECACRTTAKLSRRIHVEGTLADIHVQYPINVLIIDEHVC